jgi:hypothetical protein
MADRLTFVDKTNEDGGDDDGTDDTFEPAIKTQIIETVKKDSPLHVPLYDKTNTNTNTKTTIMVERKQKKTSLLGILLSWNVLKRLIYLGSFAFVVWLAIFATEPTRVKVKDNISRTANGLWEFIMEVVFSQQPLNNEASESRGSDNKHHHGQHHHHRHHHHSKLTINQKRHKRGRSRRKAREMPDVILPLRNTEEIKKFMISEFDVVQKMRNYLYDNEAYCTAHWHFINPKHPRRAYRFIMISEKKTLFDNKYLIDYALDGNKIGSSKYKKKSKRATIVINSRWADLIKNNSSVDNTTNIKYLQDPDVWTLGLFNPTVINYSVNRKVRVTQASPLCTHGQYMTSVMNETVWIKYQIPLGYWKDANTPIVTDKRLLEKYESGCVQKLIEEMEDPRSAIRACGS